MNLEKEILENINDCWDDFTKARYIYIKLCQLLSFNEAFNNVDFKEYNKIYKEKINLKKLNSTEIVCSTWCYIYKKLLKKIGINAKIVNLHHKWLEFKIDDYTICADATIGIFNDLYRVKKGYKTVNYAPIKLHIKERTPVLGKEEDFKEFYQKLIKADEQINYKPQNLEYTNEIEEIIKSELKKRNYTKLLNLKETTNQAEYIYKIICFIKKIANISNLGYYDAKNHIKKLENIFFDNYNFKDYIIHKELCKRESPNKVDIILLIIIKDSNNFFKYFMYKKGNEIIETNKKDILKLQDSGYGIKNSSNNVIDYIEGIEEYTRKYYYNMLIKKERLKHIKYLVSFIKLKKGKNKSR